MSTSRTMATTRLTKLGQSYEATWLCGDCANWIGLKVGLWAGRQERYRLFPNGVRDHRGVVEAARKVSTECSSAPVWRACY
jgi:hypothetical protein